VVVKSSRDEVDANEAARALTPGEVLALRGDAFAHRNRLEQAQPLLEQGIQLEPQLAITHETMGFWEYRKQDFAAAKRELDTAVQLASKSFATYYYRGLALLKGSANIASSAPDAVQDLQNATQLNPQFAPAFEGLAEAYSRSPETQKQAIEAAFRAVRLDPGTHWYILNLAYLFMNNNQDADARVLGEKLLAAAKSPEESQRARDLLERVREHEQWKVQAQSQAASGGSQPAGMTTTTPTGLPPEVSVPDGSSPTGTSMKVPSTLGVDGPISAIDCSRSPEIRITLRLSKGPMVFHATDYRTVIVSAANEESLPQLETCKQWTGRNVKIWFRVVQGQEYLGEISRIYFY